MVRSKWWTLATATSAWRAETVEGQAQGEGCEGERDGNGRKVVQYIQYFESRPFVRNGASQSRADVPIRD